MESSNPLLDFFVKIVVSLNKLYHTKPKTLNLATRFYIANIHARREDDQSITLREIVDQMREF